MDNGWKFRLKDIPSDLDAKGYVDDISSASDLKSLRDIIERWSNFAQDAWVIVRDMPEEDFEPFRKGLRAERRGKFAGEEWSDRFGSILLPEVMIKVSMVAEHFKVPWGLALHRLVQEGHLRERADGVIDVIERK
jgi:hypothetical protein